MFAALFVWFPFLVETALSFIIILQKWKVFFSNLVTYDLFHVRSSRGTKGAKGTFQLLVKCCAFIAALSILKKRNFETPFELLIRT